MKLQLSWIYQLRVLVFAWTTRQMQSVCLLQVTTHVCLIENDLIDTYKAEIEKYTEENTHVWESLVNFWIDVKPWMQLSDQRLECTSNNIGLLLYPLPLSSLDSDNENVTLTTAAHHRNSWQDAPRVLCDWSDLQKELYKFAKNMGVNFDLPPARCLICQCGHSRVDRSMITSAKPVQIG
jgi:hypothetical protein